MNTLQICLLVIFAILLFIIVLFLAVVLNFHNKMFKHRCAIDPLVKNYTSEEFNLSYKPFEVEYKNEYIRGNIYSYPKDKYEGLILYLHGMWSTHNSYMQDIEYFARNGYLVLGIDYLGTGMSTGKTLKGFGSSLLCADACINAIKQDTILSKYDLTVIGHSWGGYAASNIAHYHKDIKNVVALAPFSSISCLIKGTIPKPLWLITPFFLLVDYINCQKYSLNKSYKTINETNVKTLILHSKDDKVVNYKYNTKVVEEKCKNKNAKFIIVDGKNHQPYYSLRATNLLRDYYIKTRELALDEEKLKSYKTNTDYHALGELDLDIMNEILSFIKN